MKSSDSMLMYAYPLQYVYMRNNYLGECPITYHYASVLRSHTLGFYDWFCRLQLVTEVKQIKLPL